MHRHQNLRLDPAIQRLQLGLSGVARYVDFGLPVGDEGDPLPGQRVLDTPDGDLVAGDLAAGKQHDIAGFQPYRVAAIGDTRQGGARFALPAGGHDQHLAARQVHRLLHADDFGHGFQVSAGLGDADDPVE